MPEYFNLQEPDLSEINKTKTSNYFFEELGSKEKSDLFHYINKTNNPKYFYWDKVQYKPKPDELSSEEFWYLVKIYRRANYLTTPIKTEDGELFKWMKVDRFESFFHNVDMNTGGKLFSSKVDLDSKNKYRFISRGVMEEAIASSQLEGAHTTRKAAKEFLKEGRKPKNKSERMILNNYNTIKAIEDDYKEEELTKELLFEFHSMITKDTMEDPNESGRFRREDEDIKVWDHNTILHVPPNVDFMNSEMDRLIKFANDGLSEQTFLHPVAKAIMLHFWIGYLHPFVDGNGRLARLLFYWYLLKKDYWAFSFLPISAVIKNSPEQYKMAYLYSEGDDNDLTYFIDYNVRKIEQAIDEFDAYIKEKYQENARMNKEAVDKYELNERQISLLQYLSSNPTQKNTNTRLHKDINQISRQTAAKDLKELVSLGFMREKKKGRRIIYYGTDKVNKLFR